MRRLTPLFLIALSLGLAAPTLLAQGRRGGNMWDRLSRRDQDKDGKISREEFPGAGRMFDRLDTDGDGFITKAEADARSRGGRGGRGGANTDQLIEKLDADKSGTVDKREWEALFGKADKNGDGKLDKEELQALLSGRDYKDPAPKVGAAIPNVSGKVRGTEQTVALSKPKRHTVLVFGSWT